MLNTTKIKDLKALEGLSPSEDTERPLALLTIERAMSAFDSLYEELQVMVHDIYEALGCTVSMMSARLLDVLIAEYLWRY